MTLIAFDNARQEAIDYTVDGEYIIFCVGGINRETDNKTRVTILTIARLSDVVLHFDETDNVAFIKTMIAGDTVYSTEEVRNYKMFMHNLNLTYILMNFRHMTDADVVTLFAESPIPILTIPAARL